MKSIIITAFILLSFCFATSAQNQYIGIKSGYISADASISDIAPTINPQSGIYSALTYDYEFKSRISFGAELAYEGRGYERDLTFGSQIDPRNPSSHYITYKTLPFNYDLKYLSLPLKLGYRTIRRFFFAGNIGICPALLLNSNIISPVLDSIGNQTGTRKDPYYKGVLYNFSFGAIAELGVGYKISNKLEAISSLRYLQDLKSISRGIRFLTYNEDAYILMGLRYKFTKNN